MASDAVSKLVGAEKKFIVHAAADTTSFETDVADYLVEQYVGAVPTTGSGA